MLDLSSNALTGPLLGKVVAGLARELISLNLSNNPLSSQISAEVALLTKLTDLYLGINRFTGEVPAAIGNLVSLCSLFLPMCLLRGPLSDAMVGLVSLANLDLSNNPIASTIPKSFGKLRNLTILNFMYAELNRSFTPSSAPAPTSHPHPLLQLPRRTTPAGAIPAAAPLLLHRKEPAFRPLPAWVGGSRPS